MNEGKVSLIIHLIDLLEKECTGVIHTKIDIQMQQALLALNILRIQLEKIDGQ
jgi:hypothetical protein